MRGAWSDTELLCGLLPAALDVLPQQIAVLDAAGVILWVNDSWRSFAESNGADGVEWVGVDYLACADDDDAEVREFAAILAAIDDVVYARRTEMTAEYPCHSPDRMRWFEVTARRIEHELGRFVVVVHHDITDRCLAERRALDLAYTDALTGLPNRRRVERTLGELEAHARRFQVALSVLAIDVDDFKAHNDRHGHEMGDRVLAEVASALRSICRRTTDVAARVGGDEFAVVLLGVDSDAARRLGEAARASFSTRVHDALGLDASLSIGVVTGTPATGASGHQLFGLADRALMRAKEQGRDRVVAAEVAPDGAEAVGDVESLPSARQEEAESA